MEQARQFQAQARRERPEWVERAYQKSLAHLRRQTEIREKLEPETDLRLVEAQQDDLGITQLRLEQTRNEVEVFGGQLLSYLRGEEVQEPMGRIFEIAGIDATPYLTAEQAIEMAKGVLGYAQQFAELPTAKLVVLPHQIVNHESGPGAYSLSLAGCSGSGGGGGGSCQAQTISCPVSGSANLSSSDCSQGNRPNRFSDVYQFSGSAGQTVTINMASSAFDTYLYLISPSGSVAAEDDDSGGEGNSRIRFTLPSSGNWKIEATSYRERQTGTYTLALQGCGSGEGGTGGGGTPITWDTNATSARGRNGERVALTCPANGSPGSIWGTDVYTDDSPICTAAVHAGLITARSGGTVTLEIRPGQSSYTGSLRNGVNSQSRGSWHGSYVFVR